MPKYKVGDNVVTTDNRIAHIVEVHPERKVNCYLINLNGKTYRCGESFLRMIFEGEVNVTPVVSSEDTCEKDSHRIAVWAKFQAVDEPDKAAKWQALGKIESGTEVSLSKNRKMTFIGIVENRPKFPILLKNEKGELVKATIDALVFEEGGTAPQDTSLLDEALSLVKRINALYATPDCDEQEEPMKRLEEINEILRPSGCVPGRLVYWSAADGEAIYLLTKVVGRTCHLENVLYEDAWHSEVVCRGTARIEQVDAAFALDDWRADLRNKMPKL